MLRLRVITAVILLIPLLLSLVVASPVPFALLTLLFIAAAGWEWARLNQAGAALPYVFALAVALVCAAALAAGWAAPDAAWWAVALLWVAGGALALRSGPAAWPHLPRAARWIIGLFALAAAWLAMSRARAIGINFMLSIFCLVWMADIAAYFGGRTFGRRKLAPSISPGKSWEGVASGMAGVLLLAFVWTRIDAAFGVDGPSLYSVLVRQLGWALALPALLFLAAMSVVGDLVESLVKRAAGAKDSSRLLPGHGGVLDRLDALLPVFPVALALAGWQR
ncbi:MAG: phosphatidate cytidylyltransferase [Burkholderiales bacterium]|nr:phosphatidate cytidylyltransferase [Burkholderiales bacterium]MDE2395527.1 phosphatidate cytidylyltransferase [Burkholderiales bacterium]